MPQKISRQHFERRQTMEYKDLATLYHMDSSANRESAIQNILAKRKNSDSTFDLGFSLPTGNLFLAVPRELNMLTQQVLRRERKVSNLMRALPGIAGGEVLRSLVMDEIVMSNSIENIHSTHKQIEAALRAKDKSSPQFKRFREFAKLYLDLMTGDYTIPKSPEEIRHIYDKIMDGEKMGEPPDGKLFRKDSVMITNGLKKLHLGITPESAIIQAMESMINLVNSPEIPELYSALASHYIFEYIHPFYDGNGRTGRYLLAMFLEAPLSKPTALSLSRAMAENKELYYRAFQNVEDPLNHGEITFFVITMHELILKAQDELIERLEKNIAMLEVLEKTIAILKDLGEYSPKELEILYALLQQHAFGISPSIPLANLAEYAQIGTQQTRKYLNSLEERNLVTKTRKRNPISFALTEEFYKRHGIFL